MKSRIIVFTPIIIGILGLFFIFRGDYSFGGLILAVVFLFQTATIFWGIRKGLHNYVFIEDLKIKDEDLKQRYKVETLYRNLSHTTEWLQGFALGIEFFIENYLSKETAGPTEHMFWTMADQIESSVHKSPKFTEESYRAYMIESLMRENNITREEYDQIAQMMTRETVKETMAEVIYAPLSIETIKEECIEVMSKLS